MSGGYTSEYVPCTNRAYYRRARAALLRSGIPEVCSCCSGAENVEAHHIDSDIANCDISNLMWLCKGCHLDLHARPMEE